MNDALFGHAVSNLHTNGGLVTIVLGPNADAPSDWTFHPQIHWVMAGTLQQPHAVAQSIPTNTRILAIVDRLDGDIFRALHYEAKRRQVPYVSRATSAAIGELLAQTIFPEKKTAPPVPPPDATPVDGSAPERGALQTLVRTHADLSPTASSGAEARRLFALAQKQGLTTTVASIEATIRIVKRKQHSGSRPESATPSHIADANAVTRALESAITALTEIKDRVTRIDEENTALREQNEKFSQLFAQLQGTLK